MSDQIICKLDPIFETMGLLYVSYNPETIRKETLTSLSEVGFDGEQFYARHFKSYEKYVQAFLKNRVESSKNEFFFHEKDVNYFLILLSLLVENRSWVSKEVDMTDSQIRIRLMTICQNIFDQDKNQKKWEDLEEIIQYLEECELEPDAKWKVLRIMQNPLKCIRQLITIINANLIAYEKAVKEVARPLEGLLGQYEIMVVNHGDQRFYEMKNKIVEAAEVYPTLIFPVSQMLFEKSCYYGLLSDKVFKDGKIRQNAKELLQVRLKALSDSSKLGIIASLKISPKYNLEIAQQLGLTAATMSHHMNVLLNCGFVGVEKKEGKVYYHLERENLQGLITELEETLL